MTDDFITPSKVSHKVRKSYSIKESIFNQSRICKFSKTQTLTDFVLFHTRGMPVTIPATTTVGLGNKALGGLGGTKIFLPEPQSNCSS